MLRAPDCTARMSSSSLAKGTRGGGGSVGTRRVYRRSTGAQACYVCARGEAQAGLALAGITCTRSPPRTAFLIGTTRQPAARALAPARPRDTRPLGARPYPVAPRPGAATTPQ